MTDLTKIKTAFSLLDEEAQNELRAHGGPYEWFDGARWVGTAVPPKDANAFVWRVKPQPPKPCEWWAIIDGDMLVEIYRDKSEAEEEAEDIPGARVRIIREVLE